MKKQKIPTGYITLKEVRPITTYSHSQLKKLCSKKGWCGAKKIDGVWYVSRDDLEDFLLKNRKINEEKYMKIADAAKRVGCSPDSLRNMLSRNPSEGIKDYNGHWHVKREYVNQRVRSYKQTQETKSILTSIKMDDLRKMQNLINYLIEEKDLSKASQTT